MIAQRKNHLLALFILTLSETAQDSVCDDGIMPSTNVLIRRAGTKIRFVMHHLRTESSEIIQSSAPAQFFLYGFKNLSPKYQLAANDGWTIIPKTIQDAEQSLKRGGATLIVIAFSALNSREESVDQGGKSFP